MQQDAANPWERSAETTADVQSIIQGRKRKILAMKSLGQPLPARAVGAASAPRGFLGGIFGGGWGGEPGPPVPVYDPVADSYPAGTMVLVRTGLMRISVRVELKKTVAPRDGWISDLTRASGRMSCRYSGQCRSPRYGDVVCENCETRCGLDFAGRGVVHRVDHDFAIDSENRSQNHAR